MLQSTRAGSRETEENEFTVVASGPQLRVAYRDQADAGSKPTQRLTKLI